MKSRSITIFFIIAVSFIIATVGTGLATELIWEPVNPSFIGGNPLNGPYLLSQAQAEDNNKDPEAQDDLDRLDDFTENLNRSILSMLSARIVEQAFGTDELPNGTFKVGDFEVTITDNITGLDVTVVDVPNNSSTHISIPTF